MLLLNDSKLFLAICAAALLASIIALLYVLIFVVPVDTIVRRYLQTRNNRMSDKILLEMI